MKTYQGILTLRSGQDYRTRAILQDNMYGYPNTDTQILQYLEDRMRKDVLNFIFDDSHWQMNEVTEGVFK